MADRISKTDTCILKALSELGDSAGASKIAEILNGMGLSLQPRTVRFHLKQLDSKGFTTCQARRKGRRLTKAGQSELERSDILEKVGFVSARVDSLTYRMTFNADTGTGTVIPNIALINEKDLSRSIHYMSWVFESGLSIGGRLAYKRAGEEIAGIVVPRGKIALATICSMTINGLFLKAGIPVKPIFGGLLEMKGRLPERFVELIDYRGTSIDPLKLLIVSGMTDVAQYSKSGNGVIGASLREFPSEAYEKVRELIKRLECYNMQGVIAVGKPNMPLLDIPVGEGRTAMIVFGGLNPFAILYEAGVPLEIKQLGSLEDFSAFEPFADVQPIGWHSTPFFY